MPPGPQGVAADEQLRGIMPNTFQHIFEHIAARAGANLEFLVRASFLEIYNDEVYGTQPIGKIVLCCSTY